MRQIKFRGKCVGDIGSWAYGYYHYDITLNQHYICLENSLVRKEVIPETIGQYTGLKDSQENEIWEDDIISDGERRWHITWQQLNARFGYIYKSKKNGDTFDGRLPAQTGIQEYLMKKVIVIGNIHDNKELLTTK